VGFAERILSLYYHFDILPARKLHSHVVRHLSSLSFQLIFLHRFRELDALKKPKISESGGGITRDSSASPSSASAGGGQTTESNGFKIPDVPKPATAAGGEAIEDWTGEVRARHCHKLTNIVPHFSELCQFYFRKNIWQTC
jgi:hypothetical protein